MDEFLILLQAKLDEAKSKGNINADISKIQSQIDKLKVQAEIDPKTISNLVKQLEGVLSQKINIPSINIDTTQITKTTQQIRKISDSATSSIIQNEKKRQEAYKATAESVMYHAGVISKLNKAETNGRFYGSNRGTGYFGTGHYFVDSATKHELDNNSSYSKLPYTSIDISKYDNLFKATTDEIAGKLHSFLENLTKFTQGSDRFNTEELFSQFKNVFTDTTMDIKSFGDKMEELKTYMSNSSLDDRSDSVSTQFMKSLGYGGVDTRGTKYADTRYGTVIYDLKEESVLQANITDELQKQGQMLEKINYEKGQVFDSSADAKIQAQIQAQERLAEVKAEFNNSFNTTNLNSSEAELNAAQKRLTEIDDIISDCKNGIDNADESAKRFAKDMAALGLDVSDAEMQEWKQSTAISYQKRIEELSLERAELEKRIPVLEENYNKESQLAGEAYKQAEQIVDQRRLEAQQANTTANEIIQNEEKKQQAVQETIDAQTKLSKQDLDKLNKIQLLLDNGTYDAKYDDLIAKTQQWSHQEEKLTSSVKELKAAYEGLKSDSTDEEKTAASKRWEQAVKSTTNAVKQMKLEYATDSQISSFHQKLQEFYDKNSATHRQWGDDLKKMLTATSNGAKVTNTDLETMKSKLDNINNSARQAGKLGKSWFDTIKSNVQSYLPWVSMAGVIGEATQQGKKAVDFAIKLDDALTDVAYTSNASAKQLESLGNSAIDMAKDLNASAENILEAVKIYSTANSTTEDIIRKSQPAIMLSNISGMNGSESAKTINTSLNQFELEDTEEGLLDITDTLQYVSGQLNYDFTEGIKEITEGIEASGSVAKNAGLSMQEYATMVGVAIEKTGQSGSTIGNAYKTIFSRITKASSTEGTLEDDISAAEKSLRSVGVQVRDSANEFRDLTDIMSDLGEVWDSLSSVEKSNVGFQVAGTRQLNVLNSLFGSWESYSSIIEGIDKRTGETLKNQEVYADSLNGHLGNLESTAQSVWSNLVESKTVKSGIDLLTGLLNIVDKITDASGSLGTVGLGASLFAGFKNVGSPKMFGLNNVLNIPTVC